MSTSVLFRPTFADLRAEVERIAAQGATDGEVAALVEQFLAAGGDTPMPWVEYDGTVTWIYRDPQERQIAVVGDIVGYDTTKNQMSRLPNSELYFLTTHIPLDAHVEYVFSIDNPAPSADDRAAWNDWLLGCTADPLNPGQIVEVQPLRAFSTLAMPNARPGIELAEGPALAGSLAFHVVGSAAMGNWRRIWVYLPPDYDPLTRRYPTLYLNDGESYLLSAQTPDIADVLLTQGEIVPAILVFVQNLGDVYASQQVDDRYIQFLADELAPWIDRRYATSTDPQERAIGGAGSSATLSLYAALERPDVFGRVLAQSPDASAYIDRLPDMLERNAERGFGPPYCYIDGGRYASAEAVQRVQLLCDALLASGTAVSYQGFAGDGSFLSWRTTLPDALRFHFGAPLFPSEL